MKVGTTSAASSSRTLHEVLDADEDHLLTEEGVTRQDLIEVLLKLTDQKAVARECHHMAMVLEKERNWQNQKIEEDKVEQLEDNVITDFARRLVGVCKQAPLRMNDGERQTWKILECALQVSEYTDKIDVLGLARSKLDMIHSEILRLCNIIAGMIVSHSYERAKSTLMSSENLIQNENVYRRVFELGRRAKIINPNMMRSTYGKMMWMLMDANRPEIAKNLGFNPASGKVLTVYEFLISKHRDDAEAFLKEPLLEAAILEIDGDGKTREEIQALVKRKEDAVAEIKRKYGRRPCPTGSGPSVGDLLKEFADEGKEDGPPQPRERMTGVEVETILKSLQDNYAHTASTVRPVEKMIALLEKFFSFSKTGPKHLEQDLSIRSGQAGSCLTHNHNQHYLFVSQSLTLWKNIMRDMIVLWHEAENDMLNERYRLTDTGQGLNRMQGAPMVSKVMKKILHQTQSECAAKGQQWVGLSVVHLGDRDVPNALVFIDKYTQVPRILAPIVKVIERLPCLEKESEKLREFIQQFGGAEEAQRVILRDFFRHGFDGSGDDGGSCIDGRLTSAWNWCSQIEKKTYFPLFLLAGWQGFDG
ncbi:unnamed protein product [Amoebophrya sp. A25]|nr:unnamed protein product [Amoebophrya sp. A25]|eukprot:GSA25T00008616001.1